MADAHCTSWQVHAAEPCLAGAGAQGGRLEGAAVCTRHGRQAAAPARRAAAAGERAQPAAQLAAVSAERFVGQASGYLPSLQTCASVLSLACYMAAALQRSSLLGRFIFNSIGSAFGGRLRFCLAGESWSARGVSWADSGVKLRSAAAAGGGTCPEGVINFMRCILMCPIIEG